MKKIIAIPLLGITACGPDNKKQVKDNTPTPPNQHSPIQQIPPPNIPEKNPLNVSPSQQTPLLIPQVPTFTSPPQVSTPPTSNNTTPMLTSGYLARTQDPSKYKCSAAQEDIFIAMQNFESIFEKHQDEIDQKMNAIAEDQRIFGTSDTEGKFFNIYALLRLSGAIEKFDWTNPQFVEFEISSKEFKQSPSETKYSNEYKQFANEGNYKKIWFSDDGKYIRIPKFEFKNNFKGTILHLGDIVDRGRNGILCYLTMLYAKEQLKDRCHLIIGNHELYNYAHSNLSEDVYGRGNGRDLILEITKHYLGAGKMKFFDKIQIGGKDFLLTHTEMSTAELGSGEFKKVFLNGYTPNISTAEDFFHNIATLNRNAQKAFQHALPEWHQSEFVKNNTGNIFINQLCGHLHHPIEKQTGQISGRKGYFFAKNNTMLYLDNYSTTSYDGGIGFSKADLHLIDAGKELNGDTVFRFVDQQSDNFKIFSK